MAVVAFDLGESRQSDSLQTNLSGGHVLRDLLHQVAVFLQRWDRRFAPRGNSLGARLGEALLDAAIGWRGVHRRHLFD